MIEVFPRKYKIACKNCDSMLIFEKEDIKEDRFISDSFSDCYGRNYIVCPKCNKEIIIQSWYGLRNEKFYTDFI